MLTPEYFRRERNDGDQVPLFASSEEKTPWMDQRSVDRAASFSNTSSAKSDAVHATTLDAATDLLEGFIDDLSATEASDLMRGEEPVDEDGENGEGYVFNDLGEAASFNTARPPNPDDVCQVKKQNPFCQTAFWVARYFPEAHGFQHCFAVLHGLELFPLRRDADCRIRVGRQSNAGFPGENSTIHN